MRVRPRPLGFVHRAPTCCRIRSAPAGVQCCVPAPGPGCHFVSSGCLSRTASPTTDRACRVRLCSLLTVYRPGEASQAVLLNLFIVISTAVHAVPHHLFAPANIMFEYSGASHKVRRRNPLKSLMLRLMLCCSLLFRAPCALGPRSPASEPASGKKWQPRPHLGPGYWSYRTYRTLSDHYRTTIGLLSDQIVR